MTAKSRRSLADRLRADPSKSLDRAAARAAVQAVALINRAVEASGLTQRDLAKRVCVSESRVSQVLNGDGNVRMATLARFLRAAGYELALEATPADEGAEPLRKRKRERRDPDKGSSSEVTFHVSNWVTNRLAEDGVGVEEVVVFSRSHPRHLHDARLVPDMVLPSESPRARTVARASYSVDVPADV